MIPQSQFILLVFISALINVYQKKSINNSTYKIFTAILVSLKMNYSKIAIFKCLTWTELRLFNNSYLFHFFNYTLKVKWSISSRIFTFHTTTTAASSYYLIECSIVWHMLKTQLLHSKITRRKWLHRRKQHDVSIFW